MPLQQAMIYAFIFRVFVEINEEQQDEVLKKRRKITHNDFQ